MTIFVLICYVYLAQAGHLTVIPAAGLARDGDGCEALAAKTEADAKLNPQFAGFRYTCNVVEIPPTPTLADAK